MIDDMTTQEINKIKININDFILEIKKESQIINFDFCQSDRDFFSFIAKHIVYFKYLYMGGKYKYFFEVLISDLYYLILSIIKNEKRYMYLNERSIIENYMRVIMLITIKDNHVTENVFREMHKKVFKCGFSDTEYSLIKSEYAESCCFIHGGLILKDDLVFALEECSNEIFEIKVRKKYYVRLQNVLKIFDKLLIAENCIYISGCFHRIKSVMEYLLGKQMVNLLFQILNG